MKVIKQGNYFFFSWEVLQSWASPALLGKKKNQPKKTH